MNGTPLTTLGPTPSVDAMNITDATEDERAAYRKGWAAAGRSSDLDAAEARYLRRYGHQYADAWLAGWTARATT